MDPAFERKDNGEAIDPVAFRAAFIKTDLFDRLKAKEPQKAAIFETDDSDALQAMLKDDAKGRKARPETMQTSIDVLRCASRVPRNTVRFYEGLAAAGLQYGPAFRVLTNVWTPAGPDDEPAAAGAA